jgi:hypothetical protein
MVSHYSFVRFIERDRTLHAAGRIENANLARAQACAVLCVADRLFLCQKDGFDPALQKMELCDI